MEAHVEQTSYLGRAHGVERFRLGIDVDALIELIVAVGRPHHPSLSSRRAAQLDPTAGCLAGGFGV